METTIEWTATRLSDGTILPGFTFNPWRGCDKVSAGCKHCYAETLSGRNPKTLGIWGRNGTRVIAAESYWKLPIKWNREAQQSGIRRRVFCASLADVFEGRDTMPEDAWEPVEKARLRLFNLIMDTPWLDWLLLTKRPENIIPQLRAMPVLKRDNVFDHLWPQHFPNVWLGTSVEDQNAANTRIPELLKVPARVRFLSCEPLLGPVNLGLMGTLPADISQVYTLVHERIHWVIVGGESGPKARPMNPVWAQHLRDQCIDAGTAFFFKQHGEYIARSQLSAQMLSELPNQIYANARPIDGDQVYRVGKHRAGRTLDGDVWSQYPDDHLRIR